VNGAHPNAVIMALAAAANAHDLEAVVDCFAEGYVNETPAHPSRGFEGRDQVRKNWTQIFAAVPDVVTDVVATATDGDIVWSEWEHRGTRADGSAHLMRGVIMFTVADGRIARARFYMEPVEGDAGAVDDAVRRQVVPGTQP
jgi:ketosteroid isomerase-like protein